MKKSATRQRWRIPQKQRLIWLPLPIWLTGVIGLCVMDLCFLCAVSVKECFAISTSFPGLFPPSALGTSLRNTWSLRQKCWNTSTPNPRLHLHHFMCTVLVLRCLSSAKRMTGQQTLQDKKKRKLFFQIPTVRSGEREILDRRHQMRRQRIRHRTLRPQGLGPTQLSVN